MNVFCCRQKRGASPLFVYWKLNGQGGIGVSVFKSRSGMDMLHGSLWDKILAVAVPLACTAVLQQLFNAVDIAVVGRVAGKTAIGCCGQQFSSG